MIKHILIGIIALIAPVFPVMAGIEDLPVTTIDGRSYHYYDVEPKQTIYSICRDLGITKSQLLEANPEVADKGLKAFQRLLFPVAAAESEPETYIVRDKETFYSIAHTHGLSVADLEAANPGVTLLRPGMTLLIPRRGAIQAAVSKPDPANIVILPESVPEQMPQVINSETAVPILLPAETEKSITIAVLLPFMLEETERSRRADLMTEFYKGFLLAVDSMRNEPYPIKIMTYDTEGSLERLQEIMAKPELAEASVIIAPDNSAQLEALSRYGAEHDIDVLNLFVVADKTYQTTPHLFQATIPHDAMYDIAIEAMTRHFKEGITPVILSPTDCKADKESFIAQLTKALRDNGIDYLTIEYEGILRPDDLAGLDNSDRYAFIPTTSRQADLNRMLPALIELKSGMTAYDPVRLYGYPEWITFRGETLTNMHNLNTYLYSRFFTSPEDPWAQGVESAFEKWYGNQMAAAVPRQGLLGFDTGMFLINALSSGNGIAGAPVYHGVQNAFRFIRPAGAAGYVNNDLYFVNFRPSGLTDRISL